MEAQLHDANQETSQNSNGYRPFWIPEGVDYDTLPQELQAAIKGILEPAYTELVLEPVGELERSTGLTIVHLLWLEILHQLELGVAWSQGDQDDQLRQEREAAIGRLLRLAGAKHRLSTFLLRLAEFSRKQGGFPHAPDPLMEEVARAGPAPSAPGAATAPKVEKVKPVDQIKLDQVAQLLACEPALFAAQGTVVSTWRSHRGRRLGPYFRLAYRRDGRQCALYLGASRELAEQVFALLARAQHQQRQRRRWQRLRRQARAQLGRCKRRWELQLGQRGLRARGFEIRGAAAARQGAGQN